MLIGSFEIHWIKQYIPINITGLVGIVNGTIYRKTEPILRVLSMANCPNL